MRFTNRSPSPSRSRVSASKRESAPTPRSKVATNLQPQQDAAAAAAAEAAIPSTPERRRSFAFMKYSTDRRSSTSMHRTREHARKIAMQLSQEASTFQPTFPTSYANNDDDQDEDFFQQQQTPHRRTNGTNQSLDAHYSSHIPQQQQQPPSSPYKISLSISVVAPSTPGRLPLPRSSSSEQRHLPPPGRRTSLGQFVEQQQPLHRRSSLPTTPLSLSGSPTPRTTSMPTFPSNSSMQASFVQPKTLSTNMADHNNNNMSSSNNSAASFASGAAARRRMRNRIHGKSNHQTTIDDDMMMETATPPQQLFFYEPLDDTPPASPAKVLPSEMGGNRSSANGAASSQRRQPQQHQAQQPQAPPRGSSSSEPVTFNMRNSNHNTTPVGKPPLLPNSSGMTASSPSNTSHPSSSEDFFLVETVNPGFTFDAFGLDAHEVDNEVNAAMQELAGSHPDWSVMFHQEDEFPLQQWDSSSQHSDERSVPCSPIPTATTTTSHNQEEDDEDDDDGFVDGFRIAPPRPMMMMPSLPIHIRQSPTNSERSSLTSNSGAAAAEPYYGPRVNVFKQQAGFHSSSKTTKQQQLPQQQQQRIGSSSGGGIVRSTLQQVQPSQQQPQDEDDDDDDGFAGPVTPTSWPTVVVKTLHQPRLSDPPNMPSLGETTATLTSDDVTRAGDIPFVPPAVDFMSDTGAPSDVFSGIPSDAGVMSDVMINVDTFDDLPEEFSMVGHMKKKKGKLLSSLSSPKENDAIGDIASFIPGEEKKEQEDDGDLVETNKGSNLKAAWQKWETHQAAPSEQQQGYSKTASTTPSTPYRRPFTSISPRFTERNTVQDDQAPQQQQHSLSNQRHRLRPVDHHPPDRAMSEVGVASSSSPAHAFFNKVRASGGVIRDAYAETKSDVGQGLKGESPRFLAEAKLRKTGILAKLEASADSVPPPPIISSLPSESFKKGYQQQQQHLKQHDDAIPDQQQSSQPRRLTYRERRELELRREREERAKAEAVQEDKKREAESRDVASLIRRRVAANRRASNVPSSSEKTDIKTPVSYRDKLRPVTPKVSPKMGESLPKDGSNDEDSRYESLLSATSQESSLDYSNNRLHDDSNKDSSMFQTPRRSSLDERQSVPQTAPPRMPDGYEDHYNQTHRQVEPSRPTTATDPAYATPRREYEHSRGNEWSPNAAQTDPRDLRYSQPSEYDQERRSDQHMHSPSISQSKSMSHGAETPPTVATSSMSSEPKSVQSESANVQTDNAKAMLNAFLTKRLGPPSLTFPPAQAEPEQRDGGHHSESGFSLPQHQPSLSERPKDGPPALKDDPKYDRYFRMLKVGMPVEVVKHAMTRDGMDPTILDGDPNLPAGYGKNVPLKEDPRFHKYFKMLRIGMPKETVQHAMESDGVDPAILDQDPNLPLNTSTTAEEEAPKEKDTHRRARLHWQTLRQVRSNSLWATIDKDPEVQELEIDEEEFAELFQKEIHSPSGSAKSTASPRKRSVGVRVIDTKRANNGGIILARLKMTHDDLADAVDRIDEDAMTAEQIQNVIEYLPTREERTALEAYMLEGGQDAAEKFDGLCECEKFMVSMMTVQHAKRKVKALLFKLQFLSCLDSLQKDAHLVEIACDELSNSVRLRKLLGIVLTIGNRLNTAGVSSKRKAGAFTLESLLKLNQAKAFDKKTTFLQYVVLVVQRNNELLLRFKDDLPTVLKADRVYWDQVLSDLEEVENQLENVRQMALHQARQGQLYQLKKKKQRDEDGSESLSDCSMSLEEEVETLRSTQIGLFTLGAIKQVSALREKVEATKMKFAKLLEYFGEEDKALQPHEVFNIIVTFCREFDKAREHVFSSEQRKMREQRKLHNSGNGAKRPPMAQPSPNKREHPNQLKISSHQPNMSALMSDMQNHVSNQQLKKQPTRSSDPWSTSDQPSGQAQQQQQRGSVQVETPRSNVDPRRSQPHANAKSVSSITPVSGNNVSMTAAPIAHISTERSSTSMQSPETFDRSNVLNLPASSSRVNHGSPAATSGFPDFDIPTLPSSSGRVNHSSPARSAFPDFDMPAPLSAARGLPSLSASFSFPDVDMHSSFPPATPSRGARHVSSSPSIPDVDIPRGMQEQGHLEPVPSDVSSSALSPSPSWSESVKGDMMNSADKSSISLQQKARFRRQQRLRSGKSSVSSSASVANHSIASSAQTQPLVLAASMSNANHRSTSPAKSDTFLVSHHHHQLYRPRRHDSASVHTSFSQQHSTSSAVTASSMITTNLLELSPRSSIRQKRRNAQRSMKLAQC